MIGSPTAERIVDAYVKRADRDKNGDGSRYAFSPGLLDLACQTVQESHGTKRLDGRTRAEAERICLHLYEDWSR